MRVPITDVMKSPQKSLVNLFLIDYPVALMEETPPFVAMPRSSCAPNMNLATQYSRKQLASRFTLPQIFLTICPKPSEHRSTDCQYLARSANGIGEHRNLSCKSCNGRLSTNSSCETGLQFRHQPWRTTREMCCHLPP